MLFQTTTFAIFFAVFWVLYWSTRNRLRLQNVIILLGSYVFYGAWDERFLVLIIASTATDFLAGIGAAGRRLNRREFLLSAGYLGIGSLVALGPTIGESLNYLGIVLLFGVVLFGSAVWGNRIETEATRRKYFVGLSVIANLSILGVFKYFDFFADSLASLVAASTGYDLGYVSLNIVLPVGISFYTFQTISYSVDIYRGQVEPTHSILKLGAFVAFFPQLVAGPVERAKNLLPQFSEAREWSWDGIRTGATLFAWGLFKKVVIADNLAPVADAAFAAPGELSQGELLVGLLAFTFQIYCDFSGYSDMARGTARALGFRLMLNFNLPYFSRTPSDFWERWHISLSSWLRDYLYIPLGGNRGGTLNTYRNLMLTMLLGGLWHGASWTFVLWGAYQGAILVVYRLLGIDERLNRIDKQSTPMVRLAWTLGSMAIMFVFVVYGWLIFRAETLDNLIAYNQGLFDFARGFDTNQLAYFLGCVLPLLAVQILQYNRGNLELFDDWPRFVKINAVLAVGLAIVFLQPLGTRSFIYFDF